MNTFYNLKQWLKKSSVVLLYWYIQGKPIPPPHVYKQKVVSSYGKKFNINTLIESGTYLGDMVYGMRNKFKKIISIELSDFYFKLAKKRFKNTKHVQLILGDSGKQIKNILKSLNKPSVFWLDGHYSGGITAKGNFNTPIMKELRSILGHNIKSHVILIDDAREFNVANDYPKINDLKRLLKNSKYTLYIENDIIIITPKI